MFRGRLGTQHRGHDGGSSSSSSSPSRGRGGRHPGARGPRGGSSSHGRGGMASRGGETRHVPVGSTEMDPWTIEFSQRSIDIKFRDGRPMSGLVDDLKRDPAGTLQRVPSIRVVQWGSRREKRRWITLDNRRLQAFRDASLPSVPVECVPWDSVREEFWKKYDAGRGVVAPKQRSGDSGHDDDALRGVYAFTSRITGLTVERILLDGQLETGLEGKFSFASASGYYGTIARNTMEEARLSMRDALRDILVSERDVTELEVTRCRVPLNEHNPCAFDFVIKSAVTPTLREVLKPGTAVLLAFHGSFEAGEVNRAVQAALKEAAENAGSSHAYGLLAPSRGSAACLHVGITQFDGDSVAGNTVKVKACISDRDGTNEEDRWVMHPLTSLVTFQRIFSACIQQPCLPWPIRAVAASQASWPRASMTSIGHTLNGPQVDAVSLLLGDVENSVADAPLILRFASMSLSAPRTHLWHGPPGTGKTVTIVEALVELARRGVRTLVCAPSNQATQLLCKRFMERSPATGMALVGVEDKLLNELEPVFVDTWKKLTIQRSSFLLESLMDIRPSTLHADLKSNKGKRAVSNKIRTVLCGVRQKYAALVDWMAVAPLRKARTLLDRTAVDGLLSMEESRDAIVASLASVDVFPDTLSGPVEALDTALKIAMQLTDSVQRTFMAVDCSTKILEESTILFATLSSSGRSLMVRTLTDSFRPSVVIVDEAAQSCEAETLIPLLVNPEIAVLVGDPNQLPATGTHLPSYERPLMKRLMDIGTSAFRYTLFNVQHRMHPTISSFPNTQFYGGVLADADIVGCRPTPMWLGGAGHRAVFIDVHDGAERRKCTSSWNQREVEVTSRLVKRLHAIRGGLSIGVITFYRAQVEELHTAMGKLGLKCGGNSIGGGRPQHDIVLSTVDGFQGGEEDIIVVSCVRTAHVGFVKDFRRLNVALTRAKELCVVLGRAENFEAQQEAPDLGDLVRFAREKGALVPVETVERWIGDEGEGFFV